MSEWTIPAVLDQIAVAAPDRTMTICGQRRSTFAESAERTRRLAGFLAERGLGAQRERAALRNWECGQDRVALLMHNDLYPEMVIGCLRARTVPRSEEHTSELQSRGHLVCRLLLEKKNINTIVCYCRL